VSGNILGLFVWIRGNPKREYSNANLQLFRYSFCTWCTKRSIKISIYVNTPLLEIGPFVILREKAAEGL
jgi:hypothetical protein